MNGLIFITLNDDRLMIRADAIVAIDELGEQDIDTRTGKLALGIPEGSVARVMTDSHTFYTQTSYDEIKTTLQTVMAHG